MINRNNKYTGISKESLHDLWNKVKSKALIVFCGVILTVTLFSGCSPRVSDPYIIHDDESSYYYNVFIEQGELLSLNPSTNSLNIIDTDLKDVSELSNYKNLEYLWLVNNNISDISPLEGLHIKDLYVSNNNIKSINIENFVGLETLWIAGNFNLYTQELVDYCEKNGIYIDITKEDVKNVEAIKGMLNTLDLDGKTDFQKAQAICDFVCDHMEYDLDLCIQIITGKVDSSYDDSGLEGAVKGRGVCQSYAVLFTAMCQLSGINSYTKSGASLFMSHIWSLVEIDGQYILCDPTNVDGSILFADYFLSNSMGDDANVFMAINETTDVVRKQVESSDKSKFPEYVKEKRHKLMTLLLKCAALGFVVFIPATVGKKIKKRREKKGNESSQTPYTR